MQWDIERRGATRAVDEDRGAHDQRAGGADRVERLLHRSAGGHDVVDDQDTLSRPELESAAELPATSNAQGPLGVDRAQLKLSRDLVREDDPARRGPRDRPRR